MKENVQAQSLQISVLQTDKGAAAIVVENNSSSPFVVVCEHAGLEIPSGLGDLGLSVSELQSHVAWDPGAAIVAEVLATELKGVLVKQRYSRLVYDCNRPPSSGDAMRDLSENTMVPGNSNLSDVEKSWRIENIYQAFHDAVAAQLDKKDQPVLVTVHSFTPVYKGQLRAVDVGVLHDEDSRLADAVLKFSAFDDQITVKRNEPYGPKDGVTHTLQLHGKSRNILNVMIEIKNTLIGDEESQRHYGVQLAQTIKDAVQSLNTAGTGE